MFPDALKLIPIESGCSFYRHDDDNPKLHSQADAGREAVFPFGHYGTRVLFVVSLLFEICVMQ